ncbi:MAG: hypothetical protein JWM73_1109 [Solirubrobacterales bacterium]|nr:hypothetical protein [Solirubrobacterales bacterium]
MIDRLRVFGARHRKLIAVAGTVVVTAALVLVLWGHRHEFATAFSSAPLKVLALATALQIVALLARTEAWHGCINAAGGTVERRLLFRASSVGYVGSLLNAQLGTAARIGALRRSSPATSPPVTTLIAAEVPIMAVEMMFGALTSFTLIGPLGLAWWVPIVILAAVGLLSTGLRHLAQRTTRTLWSGLLVLRSARGGGRLVFFVMIAIAAQVTRNWALLHGVGVHASILDATAVLIAMSTLSQLPIGPSVGAAAAVLILGREGVAAVAAAGVLSTVTGITGGLIFAAWAGTDGLLARRR